MSWGNGLVMLSVLSLVGLLGFGLTVDDDRLPSPLVGAPAPDFRLADLEGGPDVALEEFRGRPVVVNFWASWCLGCIEEHPDLVRAWRRYGDGDLEMIGIVYQDTPSNARRYLERHGGGWTQLLDPGSRTAIDYGVYGIPETFFIGRDGIVSHKHIGPVTDAVLTTEIERLLAEAPDSALNEGGQAGPERETDGAGPAAVGHATTDAGGSGAPGAAASDRREP